MIVEVPSCYSNGSFGYFAIEENVQNRFDSTMRSKPIISSNQKLHVLARSCQNLV